MSEFVVPPPAERGDQVAILSPSSNLTDCPYVYEQGIERLRETFGLEPVEYPTARKDGKWLYDHPERRARDVMDAFADPEVSAAIATIGGNDQVRILEHLDPAVLRENPTRFFGWSDNTVLELYLFGLGIVSFNGGSLLTEYSMNGEMFDYDVEYLERALFEESIGEIRPADRFTDEPNRYGEGPEAMERPRETRPNPGWRWANGDRTVEGRVRGGCWGTIDQWFLHGDHVPDPDRLEGAILAVETSEERPNPEAIAGQLRALGERGLLERFEGVLVGRATATTHTEAPPIEERDAYRERQRAVWTDLLAEYNPEAPVVLDVDFGHTYPGVPIPIGGRVRIDPGDERIVFGSPLGAGFEEPKAPVRSTGLMPPLVVGGGMVGEPDPPAGATENETAALGRLRRRSHLMDNLFPIPFTERRVGLDPILGILPVIGDTVAFLMIFYLYAEAYNLEAPRKLYVYMLINYLIGYVLGSVPLLGFVFDVLWKATERNVDLIQDMITDRASDRAAGGTDPADDAIAGP